MNSYVNDREGVVSVDDLRWPFELDCRSATLTLSLLNRTIRIRRSSWREKRTLAQFAHLGEAFLKRQFLRISVVEDSPLPENEAEREAVWILAKWLNAPEAFRGLPLDQRLLASVTFDLCDALRLAPSAFETLEASEVEMLWQAAQNHSPQSHPAEPPGGATRILIVPDPPAAPHPPGERVDTDLTEAAFGRGQRLPWPASADVSTKTGELNPQSPTRETVRCGARSAAEGIESPAATRAHSPASVAMPGIAPERFRVFQGSQPINNSEMGRPLERLEQPAASPVPNLDAPAGAAPPQVPRPFPSARNPIVNRHRASRSDKSLTAATVEPLGVEANRLPPLRPAEKLWNQEDGMRLETSTRDAVSPTEMPFEDLVDELADSLEGATIAMGIDLE